MGRKTRTVANGFAAFGSIVKSVVMLPCQPKYPNI